MPSDSKFAAAVLAASLFCLPAEGQAEAQSPFPTFVDGGGVQIVEKFVHPSYSLMRPEPSNARAGMPVYLEPQLVPQPKAEEALVTCYLNDTFTGGIVDLAPSQEMVDWGLKSCGQSSLIGAISLGVLTSQLDPSFGGPGASIGMRFYAGTTNGTPAELGTLIADFAFTLPAGRSLSQSVELLNYFVTLPTVLVLPDGPIGWSYYWIEDETDPLTVISAGGFCTNPWLGPDPTTGTVNCFGDYAYPADQTGNFNSLYQHSTTEGSFYLLLHEEQALLPNTVTYNISPNPLSHNSDHAILGKLWTASVNLATTGHSNGLVFGFDSPTLLSLSGGQVLLVIDGGSGELFGFPPKAGPFANYGLTIPLNLSLAGAYFGTQGIHFGGIQPFELSNARDHTIGSIGTP